MPDENAEPCGCGWLEREANEPESPIVFEPRMNEYHIQRQDSGFLMVYYCPFCGGAAPRSKRDLLFAVITEQERGRLTDLVAEIRTVGDALRILGKPDMDAHSSGQYPEEDGSPPRVELYRHLLYSHFSDTAIIRLTEMPDGRVSISFQGKYIGTPKE